MAKKLSAKQKMFCKEYLIDLNGAQSAIRAGYSKNGARQTANNLLTNTYVQQAIQKLIDKRSKRVEITADSVLSEIAKLAFGNIKNLYDEEGKLLQIQDMPDDVTATIVEATQDDFGDKENSIVIRRKFKVSDKKANLELLGRHLKLFTDRSEIVADIKAEQAVFFAPDAFDSVEEWEEDQKNNKDKKS